MIFLYFIVFLNTFIWLFPPVKQYRTNYFYFFLVPAIMGLVMMLGTIVLKLLDSNYLYPALYLFMLASISDKKYRYYLIFTALSASILLPIIKPFAGWLFWPSAIIDLIILFILLRTFTEIIMEKKQLNLFLILLMIFQLIDFTKMVDVAVNVEQGALSFYIGAISQVFFGVAFCFININTKNFKVRVKALNE